jgi:hypothetical protein
MSVISSNGWQVGMKCIENVESFGYLHSKPKIKILCKIQVFVYICVNVHASQFFLSIYSMFIPLLIQFLKLSMKYEDKVWLMYCNVIWRNRPVSYSRFYWVYMTSFNNHISSVSSELFYCDVKNLQECLWFPVMYGFHSFPVVDWFCLFIYLWVLTFPL